MNLITEKIIEQLYIHKKSHTNAHNNFIYLGKGGSGVVYKYNGNAIKIIPKNKFNDSEYILSKYFNGLLDNQESLNFLRVYNLLNFEKFKVIEMELADGDLYNWIKQKNSDHAWIEMILQIIITIRILQQKINFFHRDLKPKNILFKKLEKKVQFVYKLNNKDYTINTDTIFYLTDFTHSKSDITEITKSEYINVDSDLYELENLPKRLKVDKLINYKLDLIIEIGNKSKLSENFKSYFDKEINKINVNLKKYSQHIKEKIIKRTLIYYLIENKLFDIKLDVIPDNICIILSQITNLDLDAKIDQIYSNLTS